jgi:hypothetical protein
MLLLLETNTIGFGWRAIYIDFEPWNHLSADFAWDGVRDRTLAPKT